MSETFDWREEDARLVEQEDEEIIEAERQSRAAEDALEAWDEYVHGLSVEDAEAALKGLREYAKAVLHENEIEHGWHRFIDTSD